MWKLHNLSYPRVSTQSLPLLNQSGGNMTLHTYVYISTGVNLAKGVAECNSYFPKSPLFIKIFDPAIHTSLRRAVSSSHTTTMLSYKARYNQGYQTLRLNIIRAYSFLLSYSDGFVITHPPKKQLVGPYTYLIHQKIRRM